MSSIISKLPIGTLNGGAQDDVEMRVARDIRKLEVELRQPLNTLNIPNLVAALNQRHAFVPPEAEPKLAANVAHAYEYVTHQVTLPISRAGYKSYQADETVKALGEAVNNLGIAVPNVTSEPRLT